MFSEKEVLADVFLKPGWVVNNALLDLGVKRMQRRYEDKGYAYATVRREIDRRPEDKTADVRFIINEDKPYYVGRIEFNGNTATQDRVLASRIPDRTKATSSAGACSTCRSARSTSSATSRSGPRTSPSSRSKETNKVQINVAGAEKGRNEIQIGGGYSGVDGAFFTGLYSTKNFLGRGQVVSLSLQLGGAGTSTRSRSRSRGSSTARTRWGSRSSAADQDYGAAQRSQRPRIRRDARTADRLLPVGAAPVRLSEGQVERPAAADRLRDHPRHVDAA